MLLAAVALSSGWASGAGAQTPPPADPGWTLDQPLTGRALPCEQGKIKIFDCQNVELLAYLPQAAIGGGRDDIWGWTDSATGREFALIGGYSGTSFIEVTNPVHPRYLGHLAFHGGVPGIAGIKVYQHYAFITAEAAENGLQVFDLTQLRDVKQAPATFQETAHYDGFGSAHTLALDTATGFAYPAGVGGPGPGSGGFPGKTTCGFGLHMIDVRVPTHPTMAGCYLEPKTGGPVPGYIHDTECVRYQGPDARYRGRELCLNASGGGVSIADVTDKAHPTTLGIATYPNVGFAHQGWLTEDQRYFFLDDEWDDGAGGINQTRTIVFDLADLTDPVVLTEYYGTTEATDHNLYIRGPYMYQSNYAAGVRIIDIADPKHPHEVGYLDTAPQLSGPGMQLGSWGNYPFFKNNVVAVIDYNGLFLVRLLKP